MQEIGRVLSTRDRDVLVLRSARPLREGQKVYDEAQNPVGEVQEIIGPVRSPYVLVRARENPEQHMGKTLYV